jgi:16S rRNA (adenine1518-N6/adenine1519-N6)-dimethyltransferase
MHKPKKSLGQNFLKSEAALKKIIETGEIKSGDTVLEIGPGKGALTKHLLESGCRLVAVEKDKELFNFLKEKFNKEIEENRLILINDDIIQFKITDYELQNYKIIANIPYNITGAILKKFLTEINQPEKMVLLVQKEVAERIVARDKKESILSISVKAYGDPKIIMKVPARYFSPAPKVDSSILEIKNISRKVFEKNAINEEKFWKIVKKGFAHKRKKLSSNLKGIIPNDSPVVQEKRAEDLSLLDWIMIAKD